MSGYWFDFGIAMTVLGVALVLGALLWAALRGPGNPRALRGRRPHRDNPGPRRRGRHETKLLPLELPSAADYPTRPFTVEETRELRSP